ncbi:HNH endonuclease family protein [Microlunatus endophyticus]|uniref:HNH endonuclease family protein n=1 Tax=Microlunatus endophyticus TaxID=1716077 RepID=UPI003570F257
MLNGTLQDPYTGKTIHSQRGEGTSSAVQIDHVVAESDAWQTGAQQWSADKRLDFATDTLNLYAVDGPTNDSKGDGDTATWLPPNKSFRCTYVAHQVAVKKKYGLWATTAERSAMVRVLSGCPTMKLPKRAAIPSHPAATHKPAHKSAPKPHHSSSGGGSSSSNSNTSSGGSTTNVVHPGSFCAPAGATGVTDRGTPMVRTTTATDSRNRWRSG